MTWQVSLCEDTVSRLILVEDASSVSLKSVVEGLAATQRPVRPGGRYPALMITRSDAVNYNANRIAARKGKRRHKTAVAWQRVIADMKRAQRARVRAAKPKKGGVLYFENPCSVRSWHCELKHDGQGGHIWN